ncbi:hypothetical protein GGF41_005372, partial [Coemansia sp. RSA 2531]
LQKSDLLDPRIRAKIIDTIDVSYGGVNGFDQAITLSQAALSNVKLVQESKLIGKFFDELALDTGKYAYGVQSTLKALDMRVIETLIVWENLDVNRVVLHRPDGTEVERFLTPTEEADRSNYLDSETGVELEFQERMPLLEWLAEVYKEKGAQLELVTDCSTLGSQFVKGFGGIGALLRYKMDMAQLDENEDNDMYYDLDEGGDWESTDLERDENAALLACVRVQGEVMKTIIFHEHTTSHSPSHRYIVLFLKKYIEKIESTPNYDLDDELMEFYVSLAATTNLSAGSTGMCYKTYTLDKEQYTKVVLNEEQMMISQGTTGLQTWEASLRLADFFVEHPGKLLVCIY